MKDLPLFEGYAPAEKQEATQTMSFKDMLRLAWRTWPFLRPMLPHLVALLLIAGSGMISGLVGFFVGTDLMTNKVLVGEKLQPLQATVLLLGSEYVTTDPRLLGEVESRNTEEVKQQSADQLEPEEQLTDLQRKTVRNRLIAWGVVGGVLFSAIGLLSWYYTTWIWQSVNQYLRVAMVERAETLSLRYHDEARVGDAIFRVYQDSSMIVNLIQEGIISPLLTLCFTLIALASVLAFDPLIALFAILGGIPFGILLVKSTPRIRQRSLTNRLANSALTSHIQETFTALKVIKANGSEPLIHERFDEDSKRALDAAYYLRLDMVLLSLAVALLGGALLLGGEYVIAMWVIDERQTFFGASVAGLVSFAVWNLGASNVARERIEALAGSARGFLGIWMRMQDLFIALRRAYELLDSPVEVEETDSPIDFPTIVQQVQWQGVGFAYENERTVLSNLTLTANAGEVTAIVGSTGAGKSTMMSLLLRLFDPDAGALTINDFDLRDFSLDDIRRHCAIALQKNVLFNDTVSNNIAFGAGPVSKTDIQKAAEIAEADPFIQEMEKGYATELGERGGKLSAGQRQRLSIARAVVRNTPILILDEPTASLDAATEHRVLANLADWGKDKVILLITHRLSTIRNADQIALLDQGQIVESGSHEALINSSDSQYAAFVNAELSSQSIEAS